MDKKGLIEQAWIFAREQRDIDDPHCAMLVNDSGVIFKIGVNKPYCTHVKDLICNCAKHGVAMENCYVVVTLLYEICDIDFLKSVGVKGIIVSAERMSVNMYRSTFIECISSVGLEYEEI